MVATRSQPNLSARVAPPQRTVSSLAPSADQS